MRKFATTRRVGGGLALALCVVTGCKAADVSAPKMSKDCQLVREGFGTPGTAALRAEVVAEGLEVPWALAFLPDGALLVTERKGNLRIVEDGVLREDPLTDVPVWNTDEAGLLGLAVHPDFEENHYIYLALTRRLGKVTDNRVERWRITPDRSNAVLDKTILSGIPAHAFHNGGRLKVGPDRMLYVTTGDAGEPSRSQTPQDLGGKLLRVDLEGEIPADNPTPGSPVYMQGLRNSQGIEFLDAETLLVADHGPSGEMGRRGGDELNVAKAGANLGWPSTWQCETYPGTLAPALTWRATVPPAGIAIVRRSPIPGWEGSVLMGTLGSRHLQRVVFDSKGRIASNEFYFQGDPPEGLGRLRDVIMGPDDHVYVTTSNCDGRGLCPEGKDKVFRIVPTT